MRNKDDEIVTLSDEEMVEWANANIDRVAELEAKVERLQAHKKSTHKLIANVCAENERLRELLNEGVRRVTLLLEIQEIVDSGPITERASRRWMAEAIAAAQEDDDE